jgi:hypothetical protein
VKKRQRSAYVRGPAARVGYSLPDLAQQEEQDHVVLTEWRCTDGVGEEAAAKVLLAPGLRGSAQSGAVKVPRGLRRTETRRRREVAVAELLTCGRTNLDYTGSSTRVHF